MKVLFLTYNIFSDTVGGVETHMFYMAKHLARHGVEVTIFVPVLSDRSGVEEEVVDGVKVRKFLIKTRMERMLQKLQRFQGGGLGLGVALLNKVKLNFFWKEVAAEVIRLKPDLVHQHDYLTNIIASKKIASVLPVVFTNHLGQYLFLEKSLPTRLLQKFLIRHYRQIIGPSRELVPHQANSNYIPNGVDLSLFHPMDEAGRRALRAEHDLEGKTVFLCPRRWAPTKGVVYLAEALHLVSREVLGRCVFLFAGSENRNYAAYHDQVGALLDGVEPGAVRLLGDLTHAQLAQVYNLSDVIVIPSLMEATSLAALEGMACGSTVLSTDVGGMPEIIEPRGNGWMVPPKDAAAMAKVITEIVAGEHDLKKMGAAAHRLVLEKYDWAAIAERTLQIYHRALGAATPARERAAAPLAFPAAGTAAVSK